MNFDKITAGLVAIGLVTAFGLHASQLAKLVPPSGRAASGVIHTVETGQK